MAHYPIASSPIFAAVYRVYQKKVYSWKKSANANAKRFPNTKIKLRMKNMKFTSYSSENNKFHTLQDPENARLRLWEP